MSRFFKVGVTQTINTAVSHRQEFMVTQVTERVNVFTLTLASGERRKFRKEKGWTWGPM